MRILHATQVYMPELGYQEHYLAVEQIRRGHDVAVLTSNRRWPSASSYAALRDGDDTLPIGESVEHGVPTIRLKVAVTVLKRLVLAGVGDAIDMFRPDVIHVHGYLLPLTAQVARAKATRTFGLLVDEHQLPYQADMGTLHKLMRRTTAAIWRRQVLPKIGALVPIALGVRPWLVDEYGCPPDRVAGTIPLGADTRRFQPDEEAGARLRAKLGISREDFVVVSSGKIAPHKRIDVLIDSVARLPRELRAVLVLVGPAEAQHLKVLAARAQAAGIAVRFEPAVAATALPSYFNMADVCAWAADCTISHLEAASCGKPIVIPDQPDIADRIAGRNGISVAVGSVKDLERAFLLLGTDVGARLEMGKAGRALVLARYSWPEIAAEFLDLYELSRRTR